MAEINKIPALFKKKNWVINSWITQHVDFQASQKRRGGVWDQRENKKKLLM